MVPGLIPSAAISTTSSAKPSISSLNNAVERSLTIHEIALNHPQRLMQFTATNSYCPQPDQLRRPIKSTKRFSSEIRIRSHRVSPKTQSGILTVNRGTNPSTEYPDCANGHTAAPVLGGQGNNTIMLADSGSIAANASVRLACPVPVLRSPKPTSTSSSGAHLFIKKNIPMGGAKIDTGSFDGITLCVPASKIFGPSEERSIEAWRGSLARK